MLVLKYPKSRAKEMIGRMKYGCYPEPVQTMSEKSEMDDEEDENSQKLIVTELSKSKKITLQNNVSDSLNEDCYMQKPTFKTACGYKVRVGIDQKSFNFRTLLNVKKFCEFNAIHKDDLVQFKKNGKNYIKHRGALFGTTYGHNPEIYSCSTNPNKFKTPEELNRVFLETIPKPYLDNSYMSRGDFNIDIFDEGFDEINKRLYCAGPRLIEIYRIGRKEKTRYIGCKPKRTALYDMAEHDSHLIDARRVEVRVFSKFLLEKRVLHFDDWLRRTDFDPFRGHMLLNFDFKTDNRKRSIQFEILSQTLGTQAAKVILNKQGNFMRDFKKVLFQEKPTYLSEVFKQGLKIYFGQQG